MPLVDAAKAHAFLTQALGLPVAWPYGDYGAFSSGGTVLGSINLEVIESRTTMRALCATRPARIRGIAFDPDGAADSDLLDTMDRRSIAHSPPMPFPAWTNVLLPDIVDAGTLVFLCDYHRPEARDVAARHAALARTGGGLLGLVDAEEIVIGSPDPSSAASRWQRILGPLDEDTGSWKFAKGPAIRIVEASDDTVEHLVLNVASLELAAAHLKDLGAEIEVEDSSVNAQLRQLADLELVLRQSSMVEPAPFASASL
ncbi:MAG TPA: hypothetical protein VGV88_08925 [Candidatus Dormibacteraeota bacterium]|nr:hypothetical protein [Candidatus Dormibacteraeota bacterium]